MNAPHFNCICGRWAWKWWNTEERQNGVLVDTWFCLSCGSSVKSAYNPPSEEAQAADDEPSGETKEIAFRRQMDEEAEYRYKYGEDF